MKGRMVIGGMTFEIADVELRDGTVRFVGRATKADAEGAFEPGNLVYVYGPDGLLVHRVRIPSVNGDGELKFKQGDDVTFTLPISLKLESE